MASTVTSATTDSGGAATSSSHSKHRKRHRRPRVVLGVTGSVAAVKAPELACRLVEECDADVRIVLSEGGRHFWRNDAAREYHPGHWQRLQQLLLPPEQQQPLSAVDDKDTTPPPPLPLVQVIEAADEWKAWRRLGDPVLHIDLRDWADVLVVAPLSAHSLAKLAHGLCDDALSCVARAWDFGHCECYDDKSGTGTGSDDDGTRSSSSSGRGKPVLLAPAMNTAMWEHPLTAQQLQTVQSFAGCCTSTSSTSQSDNNNSNKQQQPNNESNNLVRIVPPQSKLLACGEVGVGAMASVDAIVQAVRSAIEGISDP